jgi:hypothetical protein
MNQPKPVIVLSLALVLLAAAAAFPPVARAADIAVVTASDAATVTLHLPPPGLGVAIHDREARVPFLSCLLVHFASSSLTQLIGADEFSSQLRVVRKVVRSVIRPCIVFTVRYRL